MPSNVDATRPFREAAVAAARDFWKQGIRESRRGSTDPIARDSGWASSIDRSSDGGTWDWCGMFVAASLFRAGLCRSLRRGFFHCKNVRRYFTYEYEDRVPGWVWDPAAEAWRRLHEVHAEHGARRVWSDHEALARGDLATLDIQPGDVALIDHRADGKADHITLVESYDPSTGTLVTLEGNGRGAVVKSVNPDGSVVEGESSGDAVVRNHRELSDPAQRKKIFGTGRLSVMDFEDLTCSNSERRPARPPEAFRVANAQRPTAEQGERGLEGLGDVVDEPADDGRRAVRVGASRGWDAVPEPAPPWLDPAAEVTWEAGPRPAPGSPFIIALMEACLALGCDPTQAAGLTATAMKETDWGASYQAFNCGGWTITERFAAARRAEAPSAPVLWRRGPDERPGAERSWACHRAFRSFAEYVAEWIACFVPRPGGAAPYPIYARTGERFWSGGDWFPSLLAGGYRGPVGEDDPARAIREHDARVVTALRMWAQSKLAVPADGRWGDTSRASLAAWQDANGLPLTRSLDEVTLRSLAGLAVGVRGVDGDVVPMDEGWPEWALQAIDGEVIEPDALDALILALERRPAASRRAGALRLCELLGVDAPV